VRQCVPCGPLAWRAPQGGARVLSGRPAHADAAAIRRLFPANLYGGMVSFELKGAGREDVFRFMDSLKLVVRATSLAMSTA